MSNATRRKVPWEVVEKLRADDTSRHAHLAREYGISPTVVRAIRIGHAYKVKGDRKLPDNLPRKAKLTWPQVIQIRTRYAEGGVTLKQLGAHYGVSAVCIFFVVTHHTWKDVPPAYQPAQLELEV